MSLDCIIILAMTQHRQGNHPGSLSVCPPRRFQCMVHVLCAVAGKNCSSRSSDDQRPTMNATKAEATRAARQRRGMHACFQYQGACARERLLHGERMDDARADEHHGGEQSCAINCCRRGGRHTCVVGRRRRWLVGCKVWSFLRMEEGERHLKNFEAACALSPAPPVPSSPQPSSRRSAAAWRIAPRSPLRPFSLHEGKGPEDMRIGMKISPLRSGILSTPSLFPLSNCGDRASMDSRKNCIPPAPAVRASKMLFVCRFGVCSLQTMPTLGGLNASSFPREAPSPPPPPLLLLHYSLGSMGRNLGGRAASGRGRGKRGMASRWLKQLK